MMLHAEGLQQMPHLPGIITPTTSNPILAMSRSQHSYRVSNTLFLFKILHKLCMPICDPSYLPMCACSKPINIFRDHLCGCVHHTKRAHNCIRGVISKALQHIITYAGCILLTTEPNTSLTTRRSSRWMSHLISRSLPSGDTQSLLTVYIGWKGVVIAGHVPPTAMLSRPDDPKELFENLMINVREHLSLPEKKKLMQKDTMKLSEDKSTAKMSQATRLSVTFLVAT